MGESFSVSKFFDFSPTAWYKVFGLALKVFIFCLIVLGVIWVKNFLFPQAPQNVNQPNIHVAEGGSLAYTVHQGKKERQWWMPSPGLGVRVGQRTNEDKPFAEVFGELKWEF